MASFEEDDPEFHHLRGGNIDVKAVIPGFGIFLRDCRTLGKINNALYINVYVHPSVQQHVELH